MKNRFLRLFYVCVLSVGLMISSMPLAVYADVNNQGEFVIDMDDDLFEAEWYSDDDKSDVSIYSSLIDEPVNTVIWKPDQTTFRFKIVNEETGKYMYVWKYPTEVLAGNDGIRIIYHAPDGYYIEQVNLYNVYNGDYSHAPDPGTYYMCLDASSTLSTEISHGKFFSSRVYDNANTVEEYVDATFSMNSGDFVVQKTFTITSGLYRMGLYFYYPEGEVYGLDYVIRQEFEAVSADQAEFSTVSTKISSEDSNSGYQDNVSSSLSDVNTNLGNISSSMQEQATNIGKVETAVTNLQRAMEPHYDNILQQMHHITEQMAAMWTQVFNLIHVPQYARLGEILSAIQNLDVNITVDVDGLKSTINTMSTNIQNKLGTVQTAIQGTINTGITNVQTKLQSVQTGLETKIDTATDTILNSFDDSELNQVTENLSSTSESLNEVQSSVFNYAIELLGPDAFTEIIVEYDVDYSDVGSLVFVSALMQGIFVSLGPFKLVIFLSFLLGISSILFGFYRVRN